ncbi:MAG: hypothetical protein J5959_02230, partial [Butyrivibrio sp.]|nr:hypothetical protein [Butyrivibrio sp.]
MGDNHQQTIKTHNTVVAILSIAGIGAILESATQGWEFWMPPVIIVGVVGAWWMHVTQKGSARFREDFYLIFSMFIAFFHGVHKSSFFDL